jgi:hypothetical protein
MLCLRTMIRPPGIAFELRQELRPSQRTPTLSTPTMSKLYIPSPSSNGQSHAHPHYRNIKFSVDGKPPNHHVIHRSTAAHKIQKHDE